MTARERIDFILEYGESYLSGWEEEFIDSIDMQLNSGKDLTFKQIKCVIRIYKEIERGVG